MCTKFKKNLKLSKTVRIISCYIMLVWFFINKFIVGNSHYTRDYGSEGGVGWDEDFCLSFLFRRVELLSQGRGESFDRLSFVVLFVPHSTLRCPAET